MADNSLSVQINDLDLRLALYKLAKRTHDLRPAFAEIGPLLVASVDRNFEAGGRFAAAGGWKGGSQRWKKLSARGMGSYIARRSGGQNGVYNKKRTKMKTGAFKLAMGKKVLVDTARLKNSVTFSATSTALIIGTNVEYGAVHNFGFRGTVKVPAHSRTSKLGKRHLVNPYSYQVHIPTRPFLVVQDEDLREMVGILQRFLTA